MHSVFSVRLLVVSWVLGVGWQLFRCVWGGGVRWYVFSNVYALVCLHVLKNLYHYFAKGFNLSHTLCSLVTGCTTTGPAQNQLILNGLFLSSNA